MAGNTVSGAWFKTFHPAPDSRTRLVCFPHAGGSAGFFHPLSERTGPRTEVLAVQYPGRQDRYIEPVLDDIGTLADHICAALRGRLDRPTAFFGHSMGAAVAFETALRLEREGSAAPALLFASGTQAPSRRRDEQRHLLDDDGLLAAVSAMNGTDRDLLADTELMRLALPAIRGDFRAIETYRRPVAGAVLRAPVVALLGEDDPDVTADEAAAWGDHTAAAFRLETFPGGHFYLTERVADVAATITRHLDEHTRQRSS
ncbi:thioesterase II family protein [Streptomyces sp. URMC 127]|uniref:thioesterase II family protein n=1 Tax=Streptomyces sp. URMC 127 TaxID=3423402 RepID=UPI003F1B9B20